MMTSLREFVVRATRVVDDGVDEAELVSRLKAPFSELIATDDWLPERFATPDPEYYQQYLLHCDPFERFCVVSFVWGAGQETPVHNHTVWGMIGMLRGSEIATRFDAPVKGQAMKDTGSERLDPGMIDVVSPTVGDYHRVRNAYDDRVSISIHVYGANIGRVERQVFEPATGTAKSFVSGFSSDVVPNVWQ